MPSIAQQNFRFCSVLDSYLMGASLASSRTGMAGNVFYVDY